MPLPSGRPHITDETPGPALAILAICSAGASALVAGSAIIYQLKHKHLSRASNLDLEWHTLLTVALVVCIGQSAVTAAQVQYGLGYPASMLTSNDVTNFLKLEYANNLLYIASLLLLKGVQFLLQFATTFQRPNYWIPAVVMIGMLAFLFAAAFECSSPFWKLRENQCVNQTAFWIVFGLFDIITDIYSVSVVIWVSKDLKLQTRSKIKLLIILASKFLPVLCAISRLPFIPAAYTSSNYTIALYKLGVPTQIQLHLSVMALSLGKIFRFLNSLDVGYLSSSIEPTHGKGSVTHTHASKYGSRSNKSPHSTRLHTKKESMSDQSSGKFLVPYDYGRTITEVEGAIPIERTSDVSAGQHELHIRGKSSAEMPDMLPIGNEIRVTTRFEVRSE